MNPSSELRTPHWVDLSDIPEGGRKTVYWGDWPIYIAHRTPEEIASTVGFLCSDGGGYITGQTIHVNGGMYFAGG